MSRNRVFVWLCAVFCWALAGGMPLARAQAVATQAAGWGLPQLMSELAQVKSASAQFTERKTIHVLNAPLVTSGTLTYVAPDRVQKITSSPVPERFVLDHDQVTITGGPVHKTHIFSLAQYPQIGGLVEGIRATLAGDLTALDRFYVVRLSGTATAWQLILQPKDARLTRFIKWIRIQGSEDRITAIDTESSNGDTSEMSVVEDISHAQ